MQAVDWLIVFLVNGAVIGFGFYLARGTQTSSQWFLAGRALPWWAIGFSMFATNVDNADIVSVTGKTYFAGLHIITVYAIGSAVGGILAAFWIVPRIYRAGFYTNAEYLESRYGTTTRILSALIQIQYRSSMLGIMIYSSYLLLTQLTGMSDVTAWTLIVALVVLAGVYTAWGGLKSVVWTDTVQGIIMMIAAVVIFVAVFSQVGGWSGMQSNFADTDTANEILLSHLPPPIREPALEQWRTQTPLSDLTHIGSYTGVDEGESPFPWGLGPFVVVVGWTIIASGYWTVNHTQTMRLMGARSLWDMKMAAVWGVILSLPIMVVCACLGVFGRALIPDISAVAGISKADEMYPYLANTYLIPGLKGLVVAGVVAAAMSTFDSMGSALSAVFTRDIYARCLVRNRSDAHYVRVGRWTTVAVLLLGFAYLPFILSQKSMLDAFLTLIPVFVTPLFTIYVFGVLTPFHRRSGLIALICGAIYGLLALYCREAVKHDWPQIAWIPAWLTNQWAALCWSFLITGTAMAVTSLVFGFETKPTTQVESEKNAGSQKQEGWLARSSEQLPPLLEHPFKREVPLLMQPRLHAILMLAFMTWVVFGLFW